MRLPKLHPEANPTLAAAALNAAAAAAGNVVGRGFPPSELPGEYLRWAAEQERTLTGVLTADETAALLLTPRYWAVNAGPAVAGGPALAALALQVQNELLGRQTDLAAAAAAITRELELWAYSSEHGFAAQRRHAVVLDTNVLEEHGGNLATYPWGEQSNLSEGAITLVIPSVVRDELDAHKASGNKPWHGEIQVDLRYRARAALRAIDALFPGGESRAALEESPTMHPVNVFLPVDELTRRRLPSPDNEIVMNALELKPYAESVTLASYDTNIGLTAQRYGLRSLRLRYDD
ncbi:PIN domain-containing protein [Humibacter ginsengisoli]